MVKEFGNNCFGIVFGWCLFPIKNQQDFHSVGLAYQGKDIVFGFIIEYSSLKDFGP
jgi:hypothetical protein